MPNNKSERQKIEEEKKFLLLLKYDMYHLFERITLRKAEFLRTFSGKRIRDHFHDIFKNKYNQSTFENLSVCSPETIPGISEFYHSTDKMYWYLMHTEDMPATVEDEINRQVKEIEFKYHQSLIYLEADIESRADMLELI